VAPSDRGDPDDSGLGLPIGCGEDAQQELPDEIDEGVFDPEGQVQDAAGLQAMYEGRLAAEGSSSGSDSDEDAGEKEKEQHKGKQKARQKAQKTQQTPEKAAAGGKGKGKGSPAPTTPAKEAATPRPAGEHYSKTEIEEYVDKKPRKVPFSKLEWDSNRVYGQPRTLKHKIWYKYYMDLVGAGSAPRQPISNVIGYQRDGMQPPKPETTLPPTQPTTT
jgi:hypothetical protein